MSAMNTIISSSHLKGIGGHKKRHSARIIKAKGLCCKRSRHESQQMKREDYALRKDRTLSLDAPNRPMPLIDIGIKRIDELITSIVGNYEDARQDIWVRVIEEHPSSEADIIAIAKEVKRQNIETYRLRFYSEVSIDKPLHTKTSKNDPETFILLDALQSPTIFEPTVLRQAPSVSCPYCKSECMLTWGFRRGKRKHTQYYMCTKCMRKIRGTDCAFHKSTPRNIIELCRSKRLEGKTIVVIAQEVFQETTMRFGRPTIWYWVKDIPIPYKRRGCKYVTIKESK